MYMYNAHCTCTCMLFAFAKQPKFLQVNKKGHVGIGEKGTGNKLSYWYAQQCVFVPLL